MQGKAGNGELLFARFVVEVLQVSQLDPLTGRGVSDMSREFDTFHTWMFALNCWRPIPTLIQGQRGSLLVHMHMRAHMVA